MFGQLEGNLETRNKIFDEVNHLFKSWDGFISRIVVWDDANEIGATLYLCEIYEAAVKAQQHIHKLREKYGEHVGLTTEVLGKVVGYNNT
jgi:hypothetical protein